MCGRYSLAPEEFSQLRLRFDVEIALPLAPRYNISPTWAPGYEVPIVLGGPQRKLQLARFWMIPHYWSQPLRALPTAFNARSEEMTKRPFWAESVQRRRCLVPATGWREFNGERGRRRAFQFHFDTTLFAFAGVWDRWQSPEGESVCSFAIVTAAANEAVRPIHDRMPVCLAEGEYEAWLSPEVDGERALAMAVGGGLGPPRVYEADPIGNDSRREGPECIAPRGGGQLGLFDR